MADMTAILNTIRANASAEYQNRVPSATRSNIASIAAPITTYSSTQNEFLNALVNKIGLQVVLNKIAHNPLALLKKGSVPLGKDIEEIFTNMAKGEAFDATGSTLLNRTIPDVKTLYHRQNRKDQYSITVSREQLCAAFTSYEKLEEMMTTLIITPLYSGDNYDEFILMKNLLASSITLDEVTKVVVPSLTSADNVKSLVKAIKNVSSYFTFPGSQFNKWAAVTGDTKPVVTWTPLDDQVLLVRADVLTEVDIEVLAAAFNMDKAKFMGMVVPVDTFGSAKECFAMLIDRSFLQVYDQLQEMSEFYNAKGLYWNYYWNHWQTYSYSLFANAVAFMRSCITLSLTAKAFTAAAQTVTLTATLDNGETIASWKSSNPAVATVTSGGVVTAVAAGSCTIQAMTASGAIAECAVTVTI